MATQTKKKQKSVPRATTLSLYDNLRIVGWVALIFGVPVVAMHIRYTQLQTASITKTVERWRSVYDLNEEQTERIILIELKYHGSGSPFSAQTSKTPAAKLSHHKEISSLMSPENAAHFLQVMEGDHAKKSNHGR